MIFGFGHRWALFPRNLLQRMWLMLHPGVLAISTAYQTVTSKDNVIIREFLGELLRWILPQNLEHFQEAAMTPFAQMKAVQQYLQTIRPRAIPVPLKPTVIALSW
jgi:hypothetical protein